MRVAGARIKKPTPRIELGIFSLQVRCVTTAPYRLDGGICQEKDFDVIRRLAEVRQRPTPNTQHLRQHCRHIHHGVVLSLLPSPFTNMGNLRPPLNVFPPLRRLSRLTALRLRRPPKSWSDVSCRNWSKYHSVLVRRSGWGLE